MKVAEDNVCPYCKAKLNAASAVYEQAEPSPDDVTVCLYCAGMLVFTDTMHLRALNADELLALPDDIRIEVARAARAVSRMIDEGRV